MMKRALSMATIAASIACFAAEDEAHAAPLVESSIVIDGVALRPGVDTDVHLRVFTNASTPCRSSKNTIFAIHGVAHTAATWRPLAQAMFDADRPGRPVCRVVAIDLPGHGQSPGPRGALYGELTADDYVTAILGTASRLRTDHKLRPTTMMGHSMGEMLIQMTQQALLDQGTTLRDALHVEHAIMLAPSLPAALPWATSDSGVAAGFAAIFGISTPELGPHMSVPADFWATVFFQNLAGDVAAGAPSGAQAIASGYVAPESLAAFAQVTGVAPATRPEIDPGIFTEGLGTDLDIITGEQDPFVRPEECAALYAYLTGDETQAGLTVLLGSNMVHDAHVADPVGWVDAVVASHVSLP
jgi:pimeloyl-ACP methyl ester carboxylesterase